jgi:RND family efflux transporter MFP subunit
MRYVYLSLLTLSFIGVTVVSRAAGLPFPLAAAEIIELPQQHILDGVVEAVSQSTVSAQTSGRVQEILVDVNDEVPAGTVILRLRDTDQRAALAQARAAMQEAQARAQETEAEYQRVQDIAQRKLAAKSELDAATATRNAARARLDAARAGVDRAQEQLDYTVVKAPYGGIVLQRHVQIGETVQPGQALISGFSLDQLRVITGVPQRLIESVRRHQQARVLVADGSGSRSIDAAKLTLFPYADAQSNVFKVRVYLPENTAGVYPGMFVKVAFVTGSGSHLVIPQQALVQRSEVSAVYVIRDDGVSLRQLRVGRSVSADRIEILAGLDAGEQVALDPLAAGRYLQQSRAESTQ